VGKAVDGSSRHVKFAVSMPESEFNKMEAAREELRMSRSRFILLSARRWFEDLDEKRSVLTYIQGYEAVPEDSQMLAVMERIQSDQLEKDSW